MFERFTDRARRVLVLAQEEARLLNHTFIGTEHLLLGLVSEGEGIAAQALRSLDISLEAVREKVKETITIGTSPTPSPGSPPFTPRAKKVMELSLREALQLGHSHIGTEHLLLGLVREGEGVGAEVLVSLGADLGRVRQQVIQLMSGYGGRRPAQPPDLPDPRAGVVRQQVGVMPPWLRCTLCGRSLWETAHVVVGPGGRACEECIRTGAGLLEHAGLEQRELMLPPKVSGQPPDDDAVTAITTAVTGAFGPDAGPSIWATTVEDPDHFVPLLEHLRRRWGRPEAVRVAEVGFVNPQLAYVRFQLEFDGSRGTDIAGQLRRHEDRWLVTKRTLAEMLGRAGVRPVGPVVEPEVVGIPPDDQAVDQITAVVTMTFDRAEHETLDPSDRLEDAGALAPCLQRAAERYPQGLHPTWVRRIRFTGPDTADVLFAGRVAGIQPSFEGAVRRHGDRWMVTRETMVAVLARGGIEVPPDSEDG